MKKSYLILILFSVLSLTSQAQNLRSRSGNISFTSSQNVYVRFETTENISEGDTLFIQKDGQSIPALIVLRRSSISAVCNPLISNLQKGQEVIFYDSSAPKEEEKEIQKPKEKPIPDEISAGDKKEDDQDKSTSIRGRASVSSYSTFSAHTDRDYMRMRYVLSLNADHIRGSKISAETYMAFTHNAQDTNSFKQNIFNDLKIYSLAANYKPKENINITLGRKFNSNLSSMGAIDGLQYQQEFGKFTAGAVVGSRPDYTDYSFNPNLVQFGIFAAHRSLKGRKFSQSSIAFMEQRNSSSLDRRFMYLQHANTLAKNLYAFASTEINLYKVINNQSQNTFDLNSFYLMLRYRAGKKLSFSGTYDLRKNIIYYEAYKDYLEQLLDDGPRQGYSLGSSLKAFSWLYIRANVSYRFKKEDKIPSENYMLSLYFNRVFTNKLRIRVNENYINSNFLRGYLTSIQTMYDIIPRKLSANFQYRLLFGAYNISELKTRQHIFEGQIQYYIYKRLSLLVSYESVFEATRTGNRLYISLSHRF